MDTTGSKDLTQSRSNGIIVTGNYVKPYEEITFNASNFGDDIINYIWDFDDGTFEYEEVVPHSFSTSGKYNVTLTVMDSGNNTETANVWIYIDDTPPAPIIILEDEHGTELPKDSAGRYMAEEEQKIVFNAAMSTDTLDGSINSELDPSDPRTFVWFFGDNSEPDNGPVVNHEYRYFIAENQDPFFTVRLNVTDKAGNFKVINKEIFIQDISPPMPLIHPHYSVDIGEIVYWNASVTVDNFDHVDDLDYSWDFGDNTTGKGKLVPHLYKTPGIYTALLNVTDKSGNWMVTESRPLTVRGVNLAVTNISFDKSPVEEGEMVQILVNITNTRFGDYSGADAYDITVTLYDNFNIIDSKLIDKLIFEDFLILNFTWKASDLGLHTIIANVTMVNETWILNPNDGETGQDLEVVEAESDSDSSFNVYVISVVLIIIIIILILLVHAAILIKRRRRSY